MRVPKDLKELSRIFIENGFQLFLVGGAVRDTLRGEQAEDWDVATDAPPEKVMELFPRVIPTGIQHGTVTVVYRGHHIECTTFRTETSYTDGRHPDTVNYAVSINDDLSRRDFTINAIAAALPSGQIIDPFEGRLDIKKRIIRTVGKPEERFAEDGLRPLRAIRFAARLEFTIEKSTLQAISPAIPKIRLVAAERVRDEFSKMLSAKEPSTAILLLEKTGLLQELFPELAACRDVEQKGYHRFDVLDHLLLTCNACPSDSLELRLAALFHDIGKPATRKTDGQGIYTFYHHEAISAKIAESILERLRYPGKTVSKVCHLIREHMFHYEENWTDAAVRRFIIRVGEEYIEDLCTLRRADVFGMTGIPASAALLLPLRERLNKILSQQNALGLKDLKINGNDLAALGIGRGPVIGLMLKELFETVTDDPALNSRERLREIAMELRKKYQDS